MRGLPGSRRVWKLTGRCLMSWFARECLSVSLFAVARLRSVVQVAVTLAVLSLAVVGVVLSGSRVDDVRAHAPEILRRAGFEVVGSEGYERGLFQCYGGVVYFVVRRSVDPASHLYELGVTRWGSEYHLWEVRCLDCCAGGERK